MEGCGRGTNAMEDALMFFLDAFTSHINIRIGRHLVGASIDVLRDKCLGNGRLSLGS
jgi:hypothetical protein